MSAFFEVLATISDAYLGLRAFSTHGATEYGSYSL